MSQKYPAEFSSQKQYNTYINCLANLKVGDHIFYSLRHEVVDGLLLFKECLRDHLYGDIWNIIIGSENTNFDFYSPSLKEKRMYLAPAKKVCPKIRITKMKIRWFPSSARITRIIKYNGAQEEKEKAKKKKSLRSSRKDEESSRPNEA